MSIKSNLEPPIENLAQYRVPAPRRSDSISGALRCAFETPFDNREFSMLLARIDEADLYHGNA